MRKLYIVAGHSNKEDRGAYANGVWEGDLTIDFRDLLIGSLRGLGVEAFTDDNSNALVSTLKWIKKLVTPNDIAIELHFNCSTITTAMGSEVLIPYGATVFEKITARDLSKITSKVLVTKDRGVKDETETPRKRLGWMRIPCETLLLEICFISNVRELQFYSTSKIKLASELAIYLKSVLNN